MKKGTTLLFAFLLFISSGFAQITDFSFDLTNEGLETLLEPGQDKTVTGTFATDGSSTSRPYIILVLIDKYLNGFYCQRPVLLNKRTGTWRSSISPGEEIVGLKAYQATNRTAGRWLADCVKNNHKKVDFFDLPEEVEELAEIMLE